MKHGPRFENLVSDAKTRIREISAQDSLQRQAQGALLIDVREAEEFAKEHAENAQHLSKGIIEVKIEKQIPDTATEMILYCGGGNRSALVADNLQKMGYRNVASLIGGFRAWKEAGLPIKS
jgi:rhodanese-related sulfurtransferase